MDKTRTMFVSLATGLSLLAANMPDAVAGDGGGLRGSAGDAPDTGSGFGPAWSRWQARVSFAASSSSWRRALSTLDADGNGASLVRRPGGIDGFNLLGDYYFARPFAFSGGLRATSGVLVGPKSQGVSIAQPNLAAGGPVSVDSRAFGQPLLLRSRDDATTALPYIGLGYTGRTLGGSLSLSADVGMIGPSLGDGPGRGAGTSLRSLDEPGRDTARLLPVLQLGVLYSF